MDKIIVMYEEYDRAVDVSLYEYVDVMSKYNQGFIICHVTKDEYKIMNEQLRNGSLLNERLPRVTSADYGYNKFRYMIAYDLYHDQVLFNNYDDENQKGSYILKRDKLSFDKQMIPFPKNRAILNYITGRRIYTTESFEDVIAHYKGLQKTTEKEKAKIKRI